MKAELQPILTIVLGSTLLACLLGICLDLVTANVAVEYFSVHHPKIIASENPWILALFWGVAASWWFGAIAGTVVALVNQRRPQPLPPSRIMKWTGYACIALWIAMIAILIAVMLISSRIPLEMRRETYQSDRRLVAVAMAHQFEYILGAIAMLIIAVMTWRAKSAENSPHNEPPHNGPPLSPPTR
jgi:hypothetical protein